MLDLGKRHRRLREFLGLSQDQLARLAGVSQGAVSRLETARGLATPLLIVLKINEALAEQLRHVDQTVLSADLRAALDAQGRLSPSNAVAFRDLPIVDEPQLGELILLYHETLERNRPALLSVMRALVEGFRKPLD